VAGTKGQYPKGGAVPFDFRRWRKEHKPPPGVVYVGNIDARRDILDVRDAVRALWPLVQKGEPKEVYNICRGEAYRIGNILELLMGMSSMEFRAEVDPRRLRPTDPVLELGSCAKLTRATGWQASIELRDTLRWILEWHCEMVSAGRSGAAATWTRDCGERV